MTGSGAIEDYTYLWWDVRPHPNLGTVETRVFDQATRLEDTAAFAALTQSLSHRFAEMFDEGEPLVEAPYELIDDNKVRAAVRGTSSAWRRRSTPIWKLPPSTGGSFGPADRRSRPGAAPSPPLASPRRAAPCGGAGSPRSADRRSRRPD